MQEILLLNTVLRVGDQRLVSLPKGKVQESGGGDHNGVIERT